MSDIKELIENSKKSLRGYHDLAEQAAEIIESLQQENKAYENGIQAIIESLIDKSNKALIGEKEALYNEHKAGVCKGRYTLATYAIHQLQDLKVLSHIK